MSNRKRALDDIENFSEWSVRNPLFSENVNIFDDAFTLEKGLDPKYYVTHGDFEKEMCEILFSQHVQKDAKIEILTGNVGSGKTTFASYMGNYKLAEYYKNKNVFYLHMNCYNRYTDKSTDKDFEERFRIMFLNIMTDNSVSKPSWKFSNERELSSDIMKKRGFNFNGVELLQAIKDISPSDIMNYLVNNEHIDIIFIVIDNIDEIPKSAQEIAFSFALRLSDEVEHNNTNKMISILIPLRQYTDKAIDTERYHKKEMPHYPTKDIMIIKLEHVKDIFNKSYKGIKHKINYEIYQKKHKGNREVYMPYIGQRNLIVDNITLVFENFIEKLNSNNQRSMLNFIESVSSDNLKLVTKNTYNFFHSCKLNLAHMMEFTYTPIEDKNYNQVKEKMEKELYGEPIIYDLLMAIHYPFYDVEATNIANVYNLSNSTIEDDYRNTLALPRLLNYLYNRGEVSFSNLKDKMDSVGYGKDYFEKCIEKGLNYCLLDVQHGTELKHLSNDTNIKLSKAGTYMVENIMTNHRYLSYTCEDTPMEKEYVVEISNKYKKGDYRGKLREMDNAVEKFYQFIKKEENKEITYIRESHGIEKENFLREFSFKDNSKNPIMIYEKIREIAKITANIDLIG